jgi:hypothetical protein
MNQLLVEIQVKKLLFFFETHPGKEKKLVPQEYKNLIRGLVILIANSPEKIDYNDLGQVLELKNIKKRDDLKNELLKIIKGQNEKTALEYSKIKNILSVYWTLLTQPDQKKLKAEDWLQITGYLRDLEFERLSVKTKK